MGNPTGFGQTGMRGPTGISGPTGPCCSHHVTEDNYLCVSDNTMQVGGTGGTYKDISFNNNINTSGWTVAPTSFTCQSTGVYIIQYSVSFKSHGASRSIALHVTNNGNELPGSYIAVDSQSSISTQSISRYFIATVNSGNIIKVQFAGNSTGNIYLYPTSISGPLPAGQPNVSAELVISRIK